MCLVHRAFTLGQKNENPFIPTLHMMYGNKKLQRGMGPQRCSLHISFTAIYLLLGLAGGKLVKDRMTKTFLHTETLLLTAIETFCQKVSIAVKTENNTKRLLVLFSVE